MINKEVNICLDDLRILKDFKIFKTSESLLKYLKENPGIKINHLTLDHDLGNNVWSGYDFIRHLIEDEIELNVNKITFHTDNYQGFRNMAYYLINAQKHNIISSNIIIDINKYNANQGYLSKTNINLNNLRS